MGSVTLAWLDGWRRVRRAPAVLLGVFALTFAAAVPFAVVMRTALATHLGSSLEAATAADGANWDWWQEFISQASGLGATFTPRIVGFAATLDSLSAIADARRETTALLGLLAGYLALWTWLQGGLIDRFARQRPTRTHGFAAVSSVFFFRFVRLGVMAGIVYWWLFAYLHPWLFDERYTDLTRGAVFYLDPHICTTCRYRSTELLWQCPQCHDWNTFIEERIASARGLEVSDAAPT